jgi:hypothetical protein
MEPTHQMTFPPSTLYGPLCTLTFTPEKFKRFFLMIMLKKSNTSPSRIVCMLMSQIIPLPTLTLLRTWYEESIPPSIVRDTLSAPPLLQAGLN